MSLRDGKHPRVSSDGPGHNRPHDAWGGWGPGGELGSRRLWSANAAGYWSVREEEIRECEGGDKEV